MISSPLAVLKSPASGVSGAVTGYPIGRGNGVSTIFAAPPEITAITTLYRRDWQGTVALSASARTNLWLQSVDLSVSPNTFASLNNVVGNSGIAPDGTNTAYKLLEDTPVDGHVIYQGITRVAGSSYVMTVYLKAAERTWASVRVETSKAAFVNLTTGKIGAISIGTAATAELRSDGWVKICVSGLASSSGALDASFRTALSDLSYGSESYSGDVTKGILAWHPQLELGTIGTSDIPTTTAPVTVTDYVASGTTLTLAEAPALAAEFTVDGTGVNLPLLQIGG